MSVEPLWTSEALAKATGGTPYGEPFAVTGIDIDSRMLQPGDLFIALAGVRDGHDFVQAAQARGAKAALTERAVPMPHVRVPDTLKALEALGSAARLRAGHARRAAVTGSVGKTSITQAIRAGLDRAGSAHGSVKSYNNHIGVPLTLARMPASTERAVFEIGMNHADEIRPLVTLVQPHVVTITNVGPVHVENFADGEAGVAAAKAEIFDGVLPGGLAILNSDNRWFPTLANRARALGLRVQHFGAEPGCDARLKSLTTLPDGGQRLQGEILGSMIDLRLQQTGQHWGLNALCVLLMLDAMAVSRDDAFEALESFAPMAGRGAERPIAIRSGTFVLVDDSYNANPVSMGSALRTLGARLCQGRRIAVLTDMLELGPDAKDYHADLAEVVREAKLDLLFVAGPLMAALWAALPAGQRGGYAETADALVSAVAAVVQPGDVVLVKGSNGSRASHIAAALAAFTPDSKDLG